MTATTPQEMAGRPTGGPPGRLGDPRRRRPDGLWNLSIVDPQSLIPTPIDGEG
ncbi:MULTISPECIES: hypothetical protein [unclassified Synechococcus]|uniref:hypothetical protein n=1 Tax=unclassified Synechococcus TaxID=2626047 RepID=UPI002AD4C815|nr:MULTISPECIES: hypothetical protein [unclassified Synechococcus]